MNTLEFKSAERYVAPEIEVIEIELTQNILEEVKFRGAAQL